MDYDFCEILFNNITILNEMLKKTLIIFIFNKIYYNFA